ncbi:MAG: 4-hydroxybenzoate octaprenyltransferase [Pseudomonadota bacterium]
MSQLKIQNANAYWRLMRVNKPIGIYLLLWPTLWALLLASYQSTGYGLPSIPIVLVFVLGVFLMRSAGCVINDFADRHFDGKVKRTKDRPLATGEVSEQEALQLFILLISLSFLLVLTLNWQTILLSFVALLLASVYPFVKRYTHFPQIVLGAAFSWSIPMAAMAITVNLPTWVWLLYIANLAWTVAYDTQYAMVDRKDDLQVGIKSIAIFFGRYDLLAIALLQLIFIGAMLIVFGALNIPWPAYAGVAVALGLFIRQWYNTKERDERACFEAFLNNHIAGMLVTLGLLIATLF